MSYEAEMSAIQQMLSRLDDRLVSLEFQADQVNKRLDASAKGRKMIVVGQVDSCSLDPECDSSLCESAGVYRHQKGCRGTACVKINRAYYQERRSGVSS